MYSEKLEKLISIALTDGEITDQERAVLIKKAAEEGVDSDELEMVLNTRLYEMNRDNEAKVNQSKDAKCKCSACGAELPSFHGECPYCGTEIRGGRAANVAIEFFKAFAELECDHSEDQNITVGTVLLWLFFWPYLLIYKTFIAFFSIAKVTGKEKQRIDFVAHYAIPNTKEDIIEFMVLAASKVEQIPMQSILSNNAKVIKRWNSTWLSKIKQLESKAHLIIKRDAVTLEKLSSIAKQARDVEKNNNIKLLLPVLILTVLIVLLFASSGAK